MKKVEFHSGMGVSYFDEYSDYYVKYENQETHFYHLSKAVKFYDKLECTKALWHRGRGAIMDLIISHVLIES